MFRKLCGERSLRNVVIVTNMWGEVDPRRGDEREAELVRDDAFFKPVLDKGARITRHDNTVRTAEHIIRLILENRPLPLRIQVELVDEHKDIPETAAGQELNRGYEAQIRRYQREVPAIREETRQAIKDGDEETRRELETETERMQKEIARIQNDARRLESDYKREKERLRERIEQVEAEARREADQSEAQYQERINGLKNDLRSEGRVSEREKARTLKKINELSRRGALAQTMGLKKLGFLKMIKAVWGVLVPKRRDGLSFFRR